jgi:hypothetical protein
MEVAFRKVVRIRFKLRRQKYVPLEAKKGVGKTLLTTFPLLRMVSSV